MKTLFILLLILSIGYYIGYKYPSIGVKVGI